MPIAKAHFKQTHKTQQSGISLLEALITLLIVSIGMLGIAGLQIQTLANSHSQGERSAAVLLSYSILESLKADRTQALAQEYNFPLPASGAACSVPDSITNLPEQVTEEWIANIQTNLGASACGSIECDPSASLASCSIIITWEAPSAVSTASKSLTTRGSL